MSVTFDTLKYAETLKKAGFDEKQAAAQTHALKDAFTEEVASKADVQHLETDLKGEISIFRAEVKGEMTGIKGEMASLRIELQYIKWGIGAIFVGIIGVFSKLVFFMN